jgi:carboxyl-terminal processing protease
MSESCQYVRFPQRVLSCPVKTYSAINNYFAHWQDVPDLDLDSLYRSYLEKAIKTQNRYDFDLLVMEFIGQLHNGHSWFRDAWLRRTFGQPLGFDFRFLNGSWVVTESDIPHLAPGEILSTLNGESFEAFYQRYRIYTNLASEQSSRASFPTYRFLFPQNWSVELADGRTVHWTHEGIPDQQPAVVEGRWLAPGQLAYLKIRNFGSTEVEKSAVKYVEQFRNAKTLIIDVRGYAGGVTPSRLVDALMDRPYRFWAEGTAANYGLFNYYAQAARKPRQELRKGSWQNWNQLDGISNMPF